MKILLFSLFLITLPFTPSLGLVTPDSTLHLWPGQVPGETKSKAPAVTSDNRSGNVTRLDEVTDPILEVFEPEMGNYSGLGMVVCPGGGYNMLAIDHEGYEIAKWLNQQGITAFVLQYRVPQKKEGALQDAQRAIRLVRKYYQNREPYLQKIGIMGFSAGGSLSARVSTLFTEQTYHPVDDADQLSCRPDFTMLIYPAYLDQGPGDSLTPELTLSDQTPPMFITETADDPYGNSALVMAQALRNAKNPVELHLLPKGGHGYGLRAGNPAADTWPGLGEKWLKQWMTIETLNSRIQQFSTNPSKEMRNKQLAELFSGLEKAGLIPYTQGDSALFLYEGEASAVSWSGDFSGWRPDQPEYTGKRLDNTNIWMMKASFLKDARLDYKIVADGNWILDPANKNIQWSGMGPNSELQMPKWRISEYTQIQPGIPKGTLSDNILIHSKNLGYDINYKVYSPNLPIPQSPNLPVIYVTDGHEYTDDKKGAMVTVLDNLLFAGKIQPIIAVFIDPRDPHDLSKNRRMQELICSKKYAAFVSEELVPAIDANYPTSRSADTRAILGTSLGGLNAAWFGAVIPETFQLIAIQSPARNQTLLDLYQKEEKNTLKICMTTGVINDTQDNARKLKELFDNKGFQNQYFEVNEGHSWGNWRNQLDDILVWFFEK